MTRIGTPVGHERPTERRAPSALLLAFSVLLTGLAGLATACGSTAAGGGTGGSGATESTGSDLDCSLQGCGPTPLCSGQCEAECGCCPCTDGEIRAEGGGQLICTGGCYEPYVENTETSDESDDVDCSTVGCGMTPVCGQECAEVCGCCGCAPGETIEINGASHTCTASGQCYQPT